MRWEASGPPARTGPHIDMATTRDEHQENAELYLVGMMRQHCHTPTARHTASGKRARPSRHLCCGAQAAGAVKPRYQELVALQPRLPQLGALPTRIGHGHASADNDDRTITCSPCRHPDACLHARRVALTLQPPQPLADGGLWKAARDYRGIAIAVLLGWLWQRTVPLQAEVVKGGSGNTARRNRGPMPPPPHPLGYLNL
jgi:hypothetical protein